jgi:hypothetical protein
MHSKALKKESEEIVELSGYQASLDDAETPDRAIKSEYEGLVELDRCPSSRHTEPSLPEPDPLERHRSRRKHYSAPPNLEPNFIASRNLRQLTEYKWRRQQVINGVGYPGRKNRGKPQIGKLWWGFAKQANGTYTMERGHINGILLFQYFTLVHPQSPPMRNGFSPADLCDIRELHVWDEEIKNPIQHTHLSPALGTLSAGFYQSPYEPDVLRVGYGPVVDIRRDYLFCFVVPPPGSEALVSDMSKRRRYAVAELGRSLSGYAI